MGQQVLTIAWAQFRTMRNHLPRTTVGAVLVWLLSLLWYGMFAALAVFLAIELRRIPVAELRQWLAVCLLGVFGFWQLVPLFTLSSGWSLQLNKLQIYPVSTSSLFGIEVLLRITSAPEMVVVLAGAFIGLLRHPSVPLMAPLALLLFIPLNLFLSLAVRELILHSFQRNRFRELFAVLLISVAVVPQLLFRTEAGRHKVTPYFFALARSRYAPWHNVAALSLGWFTALDVLLIVVWIGAAYMLARRQFQKSLLQEDTMRAGAPAVVGQAGVPERRFSTVLMDLPSRLFSDPFAALLQKEFQSLLRMPRFRVTFGMACVFSVVIFLPVVLNSLTGGHDSFIGENFLAIVTLYGLLMMSDSLLLNVFGFDRRATQIYFVTPISFQTVLKAKNLTAICFIVIQSAVVLLVASLIRISINALNIVDAVASAAVVGLFFLCVGNLTSIAMARPIDPTQTFKKQAGGKMQLWLLLCSLGMFLLIGFAFLARWVVQNNWALLGVLLVELLIGLIAYRIATQSAVERANREREQIIEALSKGPSPVGLGMS